MKRRPILLFLGFVACVTARADGLAALDAFLKEVRSARCDFTQTVHSVPRQGESVGRVRTSSGTFEFSRPDRFRFVYRKPFEQVIVSDGQTLWLHDIDLNQVSARKVSQALAGTPAVLLASTADLKSLERDFRIEALPDREGQQWVRATPRSRDGQIQHVEVGLRPAPKGQELATMIVLDAFGQRSTLSFSRMEINPAMAQDAFQFKPPAGVPVIRQ